MWPYLPLLPSKFADGANDSELLVYHLGFSQFVDERVCLACASPFNSKCGFWKMSVRRDPETDEWHVASRPCECAQCDRHCEASNGGADGVVADRRARLLQRHDTTQLDVLLAVDESPAFQRLLAKNRVPVLELRRVLLHEQPDFPLAGYCRDSELPFVYCSFARTCAFVRADRGRALFAARVLDRVDELEQLYQIEVPIAVRKSARACGAVSAALLRIVVAYDMMREVTHHSLSRYETDAAVQWYVLQLQLFADTHLALLVNCDVFDAYDDDALQRPLYESVLGDSLPREAVVHEVLGLSMLERCYPHPLRAASSGELVDATNELAAGDIWTKLSDPGRKMVPSFIHVFLCKASNHKCVAAGTAVSLANGTSRPIEDLLDYRVRDAVNPITAPVLGGGSGLDYVENAIYSGEAECLRVTLEDGRSVELTPDHRMLTADGQWIRAGDLKIGVTRLTVETRMAVADTVTVEDEPAVVAPAVSEFVNDEGKFELNAGSFCLNLETPEARERTLAFCRLLGLVMSSWRTDGVSKQGCAWAFHSFDRDDILRDALHFGGADSYARHGRFEVQLRVDLLAAFRALRGFSFNNRFTVPEFLLSDAVPADAIREYLAALFGGGTRELYWSHAQFPDDISDLAFMQSSLENDKQSGHIYSEKIMTMLRRCRVDTDQVRADVRWYGYAKRRPDEKTSIDVVIVFKDLLSFAEKIGLRYCCAGLAQLSAVCLWYRSRRHGLQRENERGILKDVGFIDCNWPRKILREDAEQFPTLGLLVVRVEEIGVRPVYDLMAVDNSTFFANGIAVSNCMCRNFSKILCETFGDHSEMLTLAVNVLEVHALGNYHGPRFRPRWRARQALYRSHHMDSFETAPWCAWCGHRSTEPCPKPGCENRRARANAHAHKKHLCDACAYFKTVEQQLYIAVKEFYVFQVRAGRTVEAMQNLYSEWSPYCKVVAMATDDARRYFDRIYASAADITPAHIAAGMLKLSDAVLLALQCNKNVQRLRKDYRLADLMLRMANFVHNNLVVCRQWTGCQRAEDYLLAPVVCDGVAYDDARLTRLNACFAELEHLGGRRWCEVYKLEHVRAVAKASVEMGDICMQLLPSVGISPACHQMLQNMQSNSELRNMPDNSLKRMFVSLYRKHPVDFHILHYLLGCMQDQDSIFSISLDHGTAVAQAKALRLRFKLWPWEQMPADIDSLFVCRGDRRIYAEVVRPIDQVGIKKIYADTGDGDALHFTVAPFGRGAKDSLFDHERGVLVCSKDESSTVSRKFGRDGLLYEPNFVGDTVAEHRAAKSVRTALETRRGCNAPLERISLLGKLVRIGSRVYSLCVVCASPCVVSNASWTSAGPTCCRHVQFAEDGVYTGLRYQSNRFLQQVREEPIGKDANVFPLEVNLPFAPIDVKHTSPTADKLFCIGTPTFADGAFRTEENIIEWDGGGNNRCPTKAALGEFSGDIRPPAKRRRAKTEPVRNGDESQVEQMLDDFSATQQPPDEAPAVDDSALPAPLLPADECDKMCLSAAVLEELSASAIGRGVVTQRVAIQCVFCYARCAKHEQFTRVTIVDTTGVLVDSLWRRPLDVRGPVDVWLCASCFKKGVYQLWKSNVMLAQDFHNILSEELRRSRLKRLTYATGGRKP